MITAWRDAPFLLECLRSIADHVSDVAHEVIVACNEPINGLVADLESCVEGAEVAAFAVNLGFAAACNRAASGARGEYIVLLNDDTEVEPRWLEALVETADAQPEAGAVGSAMLGPDGVVEEAGAIVWRDGETTAVSGALLDQLGLARGTRQVDYCSASSLLVRRSTWDEVGGLDEGYYPAYFEDVDLCFAIRHHGQAVVCEPGSRVRHHRGASTGEYYREFMYSKNVKRFVERWSGELAGRDSYRPQDLASLRRLIESAARRPLDARPPSGVESSAPGDDRPGFNRALSHEEESHFLRLELETKALYVGELERIRREREQRIEELAMQVSELSSRAAALDHAKQQITAELRDVVRERDELVAFTQRASIRMADKLAAVLSRVPGVLGGLRWARRTFGGRTPSGH